MPIDLSQLRVALAHDWLVGMRGGEWVLDRLARLFAPTRLYTLVDDGRTLTESISACEVIASPLQRWPGAAGRWRRHYLPLMPWAVGRLEVAPCDVLISTSSAVMKSIRPPRGVPHLCYCHSPARYIWEQGGDYAIGSGGAVRGLGLGLVRPAFRRWDRATAPRVTRFLANSTHTARRVRRCYGRDADVVHPPVRTGFFTPDPHAVREPWLLLVSALEPYKRVDLVIEAANRARVPLLVAGMGSQLQRLRAMAGPTVELLGRVSDRRLLDLYRRARAAVFAQVEDFGIALVEAQAAGCPVIAYGRGGALDIVTESTGLLFEQQTVEALVAALRAFDGSRYDPVACRANAERFSESRFDEAILRHVRELVGGRA